MIIVIVIQYARRVGGAYCGKKPVPVVIALPISNRCCSQKCNNKYYEFVNNIIECSFYLNVPIPSVLVVGFRCIKFFKKVVYALSLFTLK
jgi:hypothetical protein